MNFCFLFLLLFSCIKQTNIVDSIQNSYIQLASSQATCAGGLVLMGEKKYLITATHCFDSELIFFKDEELFDNKTSLHYMNIVNDVLIFDVEGKVENVTNTKISSLDTSNKVAYLCGPSGLAPVYIEGIISRVEDDFYIIQGFAWSGCSGSLVYSKSGDVIGVVSGILQLDENTIHENLVMVSKLKNSFIGE